MSAPTGLPVGAPVFAAPQPPVALYVHFPFCVSICPYCDFVVVAGAETRGPANRVAAFVAALRVEIGLRADALDERFGRPRSEARPGDARPEGRPGDARPDARPADARQGGARQGGARPALTSLYLGGGTPSLLPTDELAGLIELVRERFGLAPGAEITLEANPGPDERGDAVAQRRAGVTRLSLGAQSLIPTELRRLGRRHRPGDVGGAVAAARDAGLGSVSLDLLYDIPEQTISTWMVTLDEALALELDHLSLYALTLDDPDAEGLTGPEGDHLPTRRGARRWRDEARPAQDDDRAAAMYHHAVVRLAADGWHGYEISNWARPGHESRHNLAYWRRLPYEAVGPGAHAFDGLTRRWNAARLDGYVAALTPRDGSRAVLPPGGAETLDEATATAETIILGLRTDAGVVRSAFDDAPDPSLLDTLAWAREFELVTVDPDDRVRLTTRGRLLSNELFARLV